jgi:hypothetical protein
MLRTALTRLSSTHPSDGEAIGAREAATRPKERRRAISSPPKTQEGREEVKQHPLKTLIGSRFADFAIQLEHVGGIPVGIIFTATNDGKEQIGVLGDKKVLPPDKMVRILREAADALEKELSKPPFVKPSEN